MDEAAEAMLTEKSDDSSSSSDSQTKMQENRVQELELQLVGNVLYYDSHVELVKLYEDLGDLESMRIAFNRFHKTFPLSPQLWHDWLQVEMQIATKTSDKDEVLALFEKAVDDYLSVDLWLQYIGFVLQHYSIDRALETVNKALNRGGLHAADGSLIWDYLRELTSAQLDADDPSRNTKIFEAFKRQLSVPLRNMSASYEEWKVWAGQLPADHGIDTKPLEWGYTNAVKLMEQYELFEAQIDQANGAEELWAVYRQYIAAVKDPATVTCLYERAAEKCCLLPDLWMEYCRYSIKFDEVALSISERAVRNVIWYDRLWILRLRILEKCSVPYEKILETFERSVTAVFNSGLSTVDIWLAFLDHVTRRTDEHRNNDKLDKLFNQALESSGLYDSTFKILRYQAMYFASQKKLLDARRVWKQILSAGDNRKIAKMWQEYVRMEETYGDVQSIRSVFERSVSQCADDPASLAEQWQLFERINGDIEHVLKCSEKVDSICVIVQQQVPEDSHKKRTRPTTDIQVANKKQRTGDISKYNRNESSQTPPFLKNQGRPADLNFETSIFLSNLSNKVNENHFMEMFPDAEKVILAKDRKGESRCFGYVTFKSATEAVEALKRDRELLNGRPVFISKCKKDSSDSAQSAFKYATATESNKLFIRGLAYSVTESVLQDLYNPLGAKAVRIVTTRQGQSKGLAYIEFPTEAEATTARERTNGMELEGHTISVEISAPPIKSSGNKYLTGSSRMDVDSMPSQRPKSRITVASFMPRALAVGKQSQNQPTNGAENVKKTNDDFRNLLNKK